jgi:preprotein translocase subunit YajC
VEVSRLKEHEVTASDLIFKAIFWKAMFFGIIIPSAAFSCYWYLLYRQQQAFIKKLEEILDK